MTLRRELPWVALAWLAAMLVAFRDPVLSGFDLGFGDRADGIIEISLLEHWRNVLSGVSAWNQPIYFHPHPGTLGYNDGYFLFGLSYSFWRIWADPFLADTLNAATFKTIGFVASWWLVRRTLGWQAPVALLVATLFTINNAMALQAVHAQLQAIGLLPVAMILAIGAVRAEAAGKRRTARLTGSLLALLMAAWLMTGFYTAWFTLWFGCMFVACWLIATGNWRPAAGLALVRAHLPSLAICGAVFAVAVIPFLSVYLAKAGETGGHGYMISYLVSPIDPVNMGPGNLIWGWLFRAIDTVAPSIYGPDPRDANRLLRGEHQVGIGIFLFALFIVAAWRTIRIRPATGDEATMRAFTLAVAIAWLLALKIWVISPWILVHHLVPGASGIRVVTRFQLILFLPVLIVVAQHFRGRFVALLQTRPTSAVILMILLLAEQINLTRVAEVSRRVQHADLYSIPAPPRGCDTFYAVRTRSTEVPATNPSSPIFQRPENLGTYLHNVDSMLLAQLWGVPTLGGYSTFQPKDWVFADPLAPDYDARVAHYIRAHRLAGVCRLDMRQPNPWRRVS